MEAHAVRDGVHLALERNYRSIEIETNALELLKLMKHSGGGRSEIASICEEIKEHSYIFFVGRQANEAAHFCAKRASLERRMCLWINYTPSFLVDILSKDCNPTV
jgi:hypothetical protein